MANDVDGEPIGVTDMFQVTRETDRLLDREIDNCLFSLKKLRFHTIITVNAPPVLRHLANLIVQLCILTPGER